MGPKKVEALALWLLPLLWLASCSDTVLITRNHPADIFTLQESCIKEGCLSRSSGTAGLVSGTPNSCTCACANSLPVYRDDLSVCVEDIHDCPLVPFATGTSYQKIPYVFLPLKGQIVYPSAELIFSGVDLPICVVSAAKYLSKNGWENLRNNSDSEPPFRLFRDENRSFLQWLGDSDLRLSMEGRLILVHLMCKNMVDKNQQDNTIFSPCVSFRIAGTPNDAVTRGGSVKEVSFSVDNQIQYQGMDTGYITVAVCTVLLGLIYIGSVLVYLKRKRRTKYRKTSNTHLGVAEEGIVKNNPLLKHCHENNSYLTESVASSTESDDNSEALKSFEEAICKNSPSIQITSAIVHPCADDGDIKGNDSLQVQETNIERLPEENVSIVETLDCKEERPESVRAMACSNARRKLYFNPAYFEPELLMAPPPAAIEFLTKIREVISIAKAKMETKKFFPSLMGIPEENDAMSYRTSSTIGSKCMFRESRERNRQRRHINSECDSSDENSRKCHNCCGTNDLKQSSIRKWLENVPSAKLEDGTESENQENFIEEILEEDIKNSCSRYFESINTNLSNQDATMNKNVSRNTSEHSNSKEETMSVCSSKTIENSDVNNLNCKNKLYNRTWLEQYEKDSLDRKIAKSEGFCTPPNYADADQDLFNKINSVLSHEKNVKEKSENDHDYEMIIMRDDETQSLPDLFSRTSGYSLISEVYVNDDYGSASDNSVSSLDSVSDRGNKVQKPKLAHLTIKVDEEPPLDYAHDSDYFEPDTLDRKPNKFKVNQECSVQVRNQDIYSDSLERPPQISLKSKGTFKNSVEWRCLSKNNNNNNNNNNAKLPLNRGFGSLREIFEAKNKYNQCTHKKNIKSCSPVGSTQSLNNENSWKRGKPKLLRPEAKQAKRQRPPSPPNRSILRPPSENETCLSVHFVQISKPPIPPKKQMEKDFECSVMPLSNEVISSIHPEYFAAQNGLKSDDLIHLKKSKDIKNTCEKKIDRVKNGVFLQNKTEDSGYLSTDSNGSDIRAHDSVSETDDSFFDGASESGAESIATDSFFFGRFNKNFSLKSEDSGTHFGTHFSDTDSNISHVTVLPS